MENERRLEILGILVIALSVFILVSLTGYNPNEEPSISPNIQIENPMGILGVFISHLFIKIGFGYITILIPLAGLIWGWFLFAKKELDHLIRSSIYLSIAMVLISVTIGVISESMLDTSYRYFISGQVGGVVGKFFIALLSIWGTLLFLIASFLMLIRGYFNIDYYGPFEDAKGKWEIWKKENIERKEQKKKDSSRLHLNVD